MKRAIVVIITIAILGFLGSYAKSHGEPKAIQTTSSSNTSTVASPTPIPASSNATQSSYKDGTYTGTTAETPYGPVEIAIVISSGSISDVKFLQMPSDEPRSREITSYSEPGLKQNAITAQSANIDFVSGATSTSYGYKESLQAALDKAAGASAIINTTSIKSRA